MAASVASAEKWALVNKGDRLIGRHNLGLITNESEFDAFADGVDAFGADLDGVA